MTLSSFLVLGHWPSCSQAESMCECVCQGGRSTKTSGSSLPRFFF